MLSDVRWFSLTIRPSQLALRTKQLSHERGANLHVHSASKQGGHNTDTKLQR